MALDSTTERNQLLTDLVATGERLDRYLSDPSVMKIHPAYLAVNPHLRRDADNPAHIEMPDAWQKASAAFYLTPNELFYRGADLFAGFSGFAHHKTPEGYAPHLPPTGLIGPGRMGVGRDDNGCPVPESHTIDLVPFLYDAHGHLQLFGGTRTDLVGLPCFVGGFVEGAAFKSVVREFIEEAVSGSLNIDAEVLATYPGHDDGERKYAYLVANHPEAVADISAYFRDNLSVGYKGPVLADPSRTDDRWIGTTAFTGFIDIKDVTALLEKHGLAIAAGSDLATTNLHPMDVSFVTGAFASHGPIACHALAHAIREKGVDAVPEKTFTQIRKLVSDVGLFLDEHPVAARHAHAGPAATEQRLEA